MKAWMTFLQDLLDIISFKHNYTTPAISLPQQSSESKTPSRSRARVFLFFFSPNYRSVWSSFIFWIKENQIWNHCASRGFATHNIRKTNHKIWHFSYYPAAEHLDYISFYRNVTAEFNSSSCLLFYFMLHVLLIRCDLQEIIFWINISLSLWRIHFICSYPV